MSINRSTVTYKKRVKRLAREIRCRDCSSLAGSPLRRLSIDEVFSILEPSAPRFVLEDALKLIIDEAVSSSASNARSSDRYRVEAQDYENLLRQIRHPKLKLASGGSS